MPGSTGVAGGITRFSSRSSVYAPDPVHCFTTQTALNESQHFKKDRNQSEVQFKTGTLLKDETGDERWQILKAVDDQPTATFLTPAGPR